MMCKIIIKAAMTMIAIGMLYGCKPIPAAPSHEPPALPTPPTPTRSVTSSSTSGNATPLRILSGHSKRVLDVAFSANGESLISSAQDMNIKLWDVRSGEETHSIRMSSVDMADIDVSTRSNLMATGEAIWDLESLQEIHVLERGSHLPASVAFSPDGSRLAIGLFEDQITLWEVTSGQPVYSFERQEENRTKAMDFSPDGALLAVGVIDGTVRLLDVESGDILTVLKYPGETDIHDLRFSPNGKYLATGGRVPAVILWEIPSGVVVRKINLTDNAISMDFSPDGKILATAGGYEYEIRLWDVESGKLLHSLPHDDQITSVAFSPDGSLLAVGCFDSNIYLWEIPPGLR